VLSTEPATAPAPITPTIDLRVLERRTLDAGGILALAIAVAALLVAWRSSCVCAGAPEAKFCARCAGAHSRCAHDRSIHRCDMTLSLLITSLMVSSLAALVVTLVVDAARGRSPKPAPRRTAGPGLQHGHRRLVHRWDCPQTPRPTTAAAARARRGRTPRSCRR
jgi:hypothetical protein